MNYSNYKQLLLNNMLPEELYLEAVKENGFLLQFIRYQTDKLCIEAVKKNGNALQFVKMQTKEICLEAIKQNSNSRCYFNKRFRILISPFRFLQKEDK